MEYRALRRRLQGYASLPGGADSVRQLDVAALRQSYGRSGDYQPYSPSTELHRDMFGALQRSAFGEARRIADSALSRNYVDIVAHMGADMAATGLADSARGRFHRAMALGLLGAIGATGEGTERSPWVVLSVDEEYAVLQSHGLARQTQRMSTCGRQVPCDVLTVVGRDGGEPVSLYFDISLPMAWLSRAMEGVKEVTVSGTGRSTPADSGAATEPWTAIVTERDARFVFEIPERAEWIWNGTRTPDNGLGYGWSAEIRNDGKVYEVGFRQFKFPGARPARGDLASLIRAGQVSVFLRGANRTSTVIEDGRARMETAPGRVIVVVDDQRTMQLLFSGRPGRATFTSYLSGVRNRRDVDIRYVRP